MKFNIKGLTASEVVKFRNEFGSNNLTQQASETFWDKLLENFKDPMIIILSIALVVILVLSALGYTEWYEGVGIAIAVALATFVSTYSEFKNEQTFQKLQEEASRVIVNVIREGKMIQIPIDEVVVNDKIFLQPGDRIPADGIIVEGKVKVNQAVLNGEAQPVTKNASDESPEKLKMSDDFSVFRGTVITEGEAILDVKYVGDRTLFGELALSLQSEGAQGPLRIKLAALAKRIAKIGYLGAPLIALAYMFKVIYIDHAGDMDVYLADIPLVVSDIVRALILAVIIVVVVVPEGLPMMIAIVLAQNMKKLLNNKVLVRQLMGIETAGSLNILFTDKTGTITKGKLDCVAFYGVSSDKNSPVNEYKLIGDLPEALKSIVETAVLENSSTVVNLEAEEKEARLIGGNTTDKALMQFIGADEREIKTSVKEVIQNTIFNSSLKYSAVYVELEDGSKNSFVKGAAEKILEFSKYFVDENGTVVPLSSEAKEAMMKLTDERADEGYRLIGVAFHDENIGEEGLPDDLTLIGFSLIRDELREDSKIAIQQLQKAGIQVVMLTGDRYGTAQAIAKDAGLITSPSDFVFTSDDLAAMDDQELRYNLAHIKVIARCTPKDKTRLVLLAQSTGLVVGMTGDGVNDSPALSNADVGFGLGSGTEVAKEASDIVILDDRLSSIVQAVHYGRTIYRSIQKFITFQLTVNVSAVLIAFFGPFLGVELPLTMVQLLWINLIMDTLAALAFSGEPAIPKYLEERPKSKSENLISKAMSNAFFINGVFITLVSLAFLKLPVFKELFTRFGFENNQSELLFLTAFFTFFVFVHNFNKFNVRVEEINIFTHLSGNKGFVRVIGLIFLIQVILVYFGGEVFRTMGMKGVEWLYILLLSSIIIPFDMLRKLVFKSSEEVS